MTENIQTVRESDDELKFMNTIVVLKKTGNQDIARQLINERLKQIMWG